MESKQVRDLMEAYASIYSTISESHFKVGDEVICKKSGMEGEVIKVDPEEKGKYYTVKREDGKTMKYAPDELKLEKEEDEKEDEKEDMKEEVDLFDYLLEYLVAEGYADTNKAALAIMTNMSEEWRQSIVETIAGGGYTPNPVGNAIRTGAGLLKSVMSNPSVQGAVKTGSQMLKKKAPTGGYSTRPGDGKPYADGPLWDGPETPVKKPQPQRKPQAPMRDEPLW